METPVSSPLVERERERVVSSPSLPRHHTILFGVIIAFGVLVYAAFNIWMYRYAKSGKASSPVTSSPSVVPANPPERLRAGAGISAFSPTSTPTPTPRPTGPGEFACDPYGVCNRYGEATRKEFCTVTFADSLCLDQCGEKTKQCKQ